MQNTFSAVVGCFHQQRICWVSVAHNENFVGENTQQRRNQNQTAMLLEQKINYNFTVNSTSFMEDIVLMREKAKQYLDDADEKTIKMVYAMLQVNAETDWWDDISDETKASINCGKGDAKAGRVTPHKEVIAKYSKWLAQ